MRSNDSSSSLAKRTYDECKGAIECQRHFVYCCCYCGTRSCARKKLLALSRKSHRIVPRSETCSGVVLLRPYGGLTATELLDAVSLHVACHVLTPCSGRLAYRFPSCCSIHAAQADAGSSVAMSSEWSITTCDSRCVGFDMYRTPITRGQSFSRCSHLSRHI